MAPQRDTAGRGVLWWTNVPARHAGGPSPRGCLPL